MRRTSVLCLLLSAFVLLSCQDDAAKLAEHLERGDSYFEDERYNEAIIEFKSALQLDPNYGPAHYKLARAYFRSEKPRDGFWELRETVRLDPTNLDARIEFAQLAILAGEAEEALDLMEATIQADASDVRAHLVKGQALDHLKRFDEANEVYKVAYEVDPEHEGSLRAMARAHQRNGNKDAAFETYGLLLEKHPTFANYSLVARASPKLLSSEPEEERYAKREELLRRSVEVAEGDDRGLAYEQLVSFFVNQKRVPEAFEILEKAAETEEDKVPILYLIARLHRSQGDEEKADRLLEEATAQRPDDPNVHLVLATYRVRQDDYEGALVAIERALELDPDLRRAQLQKAEVLMELGFRRQKVGAVDEARRMLDTILEAEPSNPFALVADAKYKLGTQDLDGAIRALRTALEGQPNWAQAYYLLGLALAAQQDFDGARTELAKSLELDASQLRAKATLAEVHFRLGEWQYCVDRAREYLKEQPGDNSVRLILAQSLVRLGQMAEAEAELAGLPEEARTAEVYFALGRLQDGKGNPAKARAYLMTADDKLPNNWEVLGALLMLDKREGRLDESKRRIEKAIEASPQDAKLHQMAALVAFNERRIDDAEASLLKAMELAPEDLSAYQRLARLYANTGRLEQTTQTYERALAVNPRASTIHHFLGVLYELGGDTERAIERYESAVEHGPHLAEAKNNLAYLYAEQGRELDRALDLAQEAKARLPDNPSVSDTLGWVLYKRGVPAAAISYLKEAEASTEPGDDSVGVIQYHLAVALDATGQEREAKKVLRRALNALEERKQAAERAGGKPPPEPRWAPGARELRAKLTPGLAVNP